MLQNATRLRKSAPVLRLPRKMHLCRSSADIPRLPWFLEMLQNLTFSSLLTRCTIPCACHAKRHLNLQKCPNPWCFLHFDFATCFAHNGVHFSTSQFSKVVRTWCALYILASKFALRHNSVHFFDISTSKSGPSTVCFVHFDLEMCFAPQRRALFRIATSKSAPKLKCFVHFDFKMCFAPQWRAIFHLSSGQMAPHPPL